MYLKCLKFRFDICKLSVIIRVIKLYLHVLFQQTQLLQLIPVVFRALLSDGNRAIHQRTLEVFSVFAEETKHASILQDSLQGDEAVRDSVVSYLNQVQAALL